MAEIKIKADNNNGTVSLKGPSATTGNAAVQLTLPVDDGTTGQFLKTDGSGVMSWATVDTSIADNSITGDKIAMGSDAAGDVLYYNGTDYIRLAKGTDGQVLTLASGVPTWATPAQDYVKIFTETLSSNTAGWSVLKSAQATLFDSTYSWKFLKFTNIRPESDYGVWEMRLTFNGQSGTFQTGSSYHYAEHELLPASSQNLRATTSAGKLDIMHHWGNASGESGDLELWWSDVHSTGSAKFIQWRGMCRNYDGGKPQMNTGGGYWSGSECNNALEGIQIDGNNGGLGDCKIDAYGLK